MSKRMCFSLAVLCLPLLAPVMASTQQPTEPPVFTRVAVWQVPRTQWEATVEAFNRDSRPVLERLLAEGKIISSGNGEIVIHGEEGWTHVDWAQASSLAAAQGVVDAFQAAARALPEAERQRRGAEFAARVTKHRDFLLRSLVHRGRTAGRTTGYVWGTVREMKPGRGDEWLDLWKKYIQPVYDELLANGTILAYEVSVQHFVSDSPNLRYIWYVAPNLEAIDKVRETFAASFQKRSAEERQAIFTDLGENEVPASVRNFFDRLVNFAHK